MGITLGMTALITVMSVMNGFQKEVRTRILGVASHVQIGSIHGNLSHWQQIAEEAINIQETAVNQASQPTESATVIIPLIPKGGRLFYGWDLVDKKAATKKGWTKTILDDELVNQFFKENKDKIVDEVGITEGGVRFFVKKKY